MTLEEMNRLAIQISQQQIKESVPKPCPNEAPNPGTYFGAMHALMYLKKNGLLK